MKGFLLSLEALIAVGLLILVAFFLSGLSVTNTPEVRYQRLYLTAKDALNIMENAQISETKSLPTLNSYIQQGIITSQNGTLLDAIGFLWASGNVTLAGDLAHEVMETIFNGSNTNYQITMGNTILTQKNSTASGNFIAKVSTVASGYDVGKPISGFVSRAYVTAPAKQDNAYAFFGGYVGDGNITKRIELPSLDAVLSAELELDTGNNFTLSINGNFSGTYTKSASGNLSAERWTVPTQYLGFFAPGKNIIGLNFSSGASNYIGGGNIKVTFNTTQLVVASQLSYGANASGNYTFPGIRGIINLFDSFYVPGNLTNLSAYLEYQSSYRIFLVIGNKTIYASNATSLKNVTIPNSNLSLQLNYGDLSGKTIPVRLGTENLTLLGGLGALDTSLITDRTGSMTSCDVNASCSDSNLCDSDPSGGCHISRNLVALEADRTFVDVIASTPGNNVGLIGYGERAAPTCSFTEISNDNQTLQSEINDYNYNNIWQSCGWTCISCGVESSTIQLTEYEKLYGYRKTSATNTSVIHVGDTGPLAVNVTFNMTLNTSRFLKGRIIILGTNTDVVSGYQDCISLNNNYLGRICESDGSTAVSWHTCIYPVKPEWLKNGTNTITVTGGNVTSCLGNPADLTDQDDWDFKSVEMSVWELNNDATSTTELANASAYQLNSPLTVSYLDFADLWELQADQPYPVDFTSGYNTTGNTFGPGGAVQNDGWDWDTENGSGPYGYDDDIDYNGVVNGKLDFDIRQGGSNTCTNRDCSGAYGIQINVTSTLYNQIVSGGKMYVSFTYEWQANPANPFEPGDQTWIKGKWTSPVSGEHWLGSNLDSGQSGADANPEIATVDNPDAGMSGYFSQNITPWIEGTGFYYLDFGGAVLANSADEWGTFRFDDVAVGIYNSTVSGLGNEYNVTFSVANASSVRAATVDFDALDIDLSSYDCLFLNNNMLGRIDEQKWNSSPVWQNVLFDLPVAWLTNGTNAITFTGGTTQGCKRVGAANDSWTFRKVNISLKISNESYDYPRTKSMLIMSDGEANTKIGDCTDYGSSGCPTISGAETPSQETIRKACEARNTYGIKIYAVAFGNAGQQSIDTLNQSAGCDSYANFYTSNTKDQLVQIYRAIAQNMVNISFQAQTAVVAGNVSLNNTLSPNSYISYSYVSTIPSLQYGEVTFTFESLPLRNSTGGTLITDNVTGTKEGWVFLPPETSVIDARITSYSSAYWTDRLYVRGAGQNDTRVYWLDDYKTPYSSLGDPYNVYIPANLLSPGANNSVKIGTGLAPSNATGGSPDAKVIYTLRLNTLNLEGYSGVFHKAAGATPRVYYDLNGDDIFDASRLVPYGPNPSDPFDPENDSIDDAFMRLMDNLNLLYDKNPGTYGNGSAADPYDGLNQSNPIDIALTSDIFIDSASVTGVTSLWGPVPLTIAVWT